MMLDSHFLRSVKVKKYCRYSPTFPFFQLDEKLKKNAFLVQELVQKRQLFLSFFVSQTSITNLFLTSVNLKKCSRYSSIFPFFQLDEKLRKNVFWFKNLFKNNGLPCLFWSLKAILLIYSNLFLTTVNLKKCARYSPTFSFFQLDEKLKKIHSNLFKNYGFYCLFWSLKPLVLIYS